MCNIVHYIIYTMKTPQNTVTFLLEAGGTSLVGVWRKVCGRRVTRGWSDHAVNCDSISQLATTAQKATSCLADGMERAETIWPEVTGADWLVCGIMVDVGVQVFVDRMTLVHRRIVGRWICQRKLSPTPS